MLAASTKTDATGELRVYVTPPPVGQEQQAPSTVPLLHTCATDPRRFRNTPPPVLQRQDCPSTRICTQSTSAPRPQVGLCSWTTLETTDASGAPTSAMPSSPNVVAGSTLLLVCVTRSMKSSYALCRSFSARAESNCIRGPSATLSRDIDSCYPLLDVLWS